MPTPVVVGIDLSGSDRRPSTLAMLDSNQNLFIYNFQHLKEIIGFVIEKSPKAIAIDAPFQLPNRGAFRECDRKMKKIGVKPLPPIWDSMKKLVYRAREILEKLDKSYIIVETFPTGALNLLKMKNIKDRKTQMGVFNRIVEAYKFKLVTKVFFVKDVLDATLCAIAALNYIRGWGYIEIKDDEGCRIVIPKLFI
ncbi:MAG: DUF429 domain-containing protein [Candidatus Njordarchaeia archaeon]